MRVHANFVIVVIVSCLLMACGGGSNSGQSEFQVPSQIVSDRFRDCLESQADQKGWRSVSDVRDIECLVDFSGPDVGRGVENLEGAELFTNLEEIVIYSSGRYGLGQVEDLSPLSRLTRLRTIEMYSSAIESFDSIRNLSSLQKLVIVPSRVNDLSALPTLTGLRHLNISGATLDGPPIDDFSPLGQLGALEELHLQAHYALAQSGIGFLNGMPNLRVLNLAENGLQSASEIQGLAMLEVLDLSFNNLFTSFDDTMIESVLGSLSGLKEFYYAGFDGHDATFLQGMTSLEVLVVTQYSQLSVADTIAIGGLTSLRELYLGGFFSLEMTPLHNLSNLEILWLANGTVNSETLAFPATMSSLRELHMLDAFSFHYYVGDSRGDFKSDYAVFEDLPALETLDLVKPWLSNESAVTANPGITNLAMVEANLNSVEFLRDSTGINTLDLSENPFTEIDPLATMPDLTELTINGTLVSCADLAEFRALVPQVTVRTDLDCS